VRQAALAAALVMVVLLGVRVRLGKVLLAASPPPRVQMFLVVVGAAVLPQ
tara:strand:+ start:267 stop:416 length:150 start_codon:yes stop_codon:yes gene_type:complete